MGPIKPPWRDDKNIREKLDAGVQLSKYELYRAYQLGWREPPCCRWGSGPSPSSRLSRAMERISRDRYLTPQEVCDRTWRLVECTGAAPGTWTRIVEAAVGYDARYTGMVYGKTLIRSFEPGYTALLRTKGDYPELNPQEFYRVYMEMNPTEKTDHWPGVCRSCGVTGNPETVSSRSFEDWAPDPLFTRLASHVGRYRGHTFMRVDLCTTCYARGCKAEKAGQEVKEAKKQLDRMETIARLPDDDEFQTKRGDIPDYLQHLVLLKREHTQLNRINQAAKQLLKEMNHE